MKAEPLSSIKKELQHHTHESLLQLCLRLGRFKKENKELLTYLLFEAHNEAQYIETVKLEVEALFSSINTNSFFYIKKSVRKILRLLKKYSRYSQKKETEIELLLFFCEKLNTFSPSIFNNVTLNNIYNRQLVYIEKALKQLHEDLQYDYGLKLEHLKKPS